MKPRPTNAPGPHRPGPTGSIMPDELLPRSILSARLGWGPRAITAAKAQGLRALVFAHREYFLGRDVIIFLQTARKETPL